MILSDKEPVKRAEESLKKFNSEINVIYLRPAYFDDDLLVSVELAELPTSRLIFNYTIKKEEEVIVTGTTVLAFLNKETKKPVKCPDYMLEKVTPLFK